MTTNDHLIDEILNQIKDHYLEKLEKASTEEEQKEILEDFRKVDIEGLVNESVDSLKDNILNGMITSRFERAMLYREEDTLFLSSHRYKWNRGFVASEVLYLFSIEVITEYKDIIDSMDDKSIFDDPKYIATSYIVSRACQQFLEILTLVKGGFADGATARWRSLYELSIITSFTSFITEQESIVADAFIHHDSRNGYYEWARKSGLFDAIKTIRLSDIRKKCALNTSGWKNDYLTACAAIHPSSEATFDRLGMPSGINDVIPVGRTDYGVDIPAILSAYSLCQILIMFLNLYPNATILSSMKTMIEYLSFLEKEYKKDFEEIEWNI